MGNKFKYEEIPVENLSLDDANPRIAWVKDMNPDFNQNKDVHMEQALCDESPSFIALQASIKEMGGINFPIIVNRQKDGKMVVIEGNTRLQIYKKFLRENVGGDWTKIPANVHEDLDPKIIESIRIHAHIVGTREWNAYSKAKYLHDKSEFEHLSLKEIVGFVGGHASEIKKDIEAYKDMENHYRKAVEDKDDGTDFNPTRFSLWAQLQIGDRMQAIRTAGFSRDTVAEWDIEGKFDPIRKFRQIKSILENPESKKIFLKHVDKGGGAREALKVIDHSQTSLKDITDKQLAKELFNRIRKWGYDEYKQLGSGADDLETDFINLKEELNEALDESNNFKNS